MEVRLPCRIQEVTRSLSDQDRLIRQSSEDWNGSSASVASLRVATVLRPLADDDLDWLFAWENDERAVEMAAFTRPDASDRRSFDAHYERVRHDPGVTIRAIDDDG